MRPSHGQRLKGPGVVRSVGAMLCVLATGLASCAQDTTVEVIVGGDLVPGTDADQISIETWRGGAQLDRAEHGLDATEHWPQGYLLVLGTGVNDSVDITVSASLSGSAVVEATRSNVAAIPGDAVMVGICLWRRCAGSDEEACRDGSCDRGR